MDDINYKEINEDINLEDLEYVCNLDTGDNYDDGIFPRLDFMINVDDE
mgnify:CR=1 FL=1